ncbi:MAG TPA: (Na+)-NQR maturation NqrM [Candidatus Hydrogenedentes bacterium]|nr:(Na+)-NQR maturation NqrM [Candidatus Hydrogenedentota bacterium]
MSILATISLVLTFFGIAFVLMAVGVIFSGKTLRGSCGGTPTFGPDGELLTCDTCPNKGKYRQGECPREG